jgi:hypothetical protein
MYLFIILNKSRSTFIFPSLPRKITDRELRVLVLTLPPYLRCTSEDRRSIDTILTKSQRPTILLLPDDSSFRSSYLSEWPRSLPYLQVGTLRLARTIMRQLVIRFITLLSIKASMQL